MLKSFFRNSASIIAASSILLYGNIALAQGGIEDFFGKAAGALGRAVEDGVAEGLGISTYRQSPIYKRHLAPYIVDVGRFDLFVKKYKDIDNVSNKDLAEILVSLGIPQIAPQWLSPAGVNLVNKYYPGVIGKKSGNNDFNFYRSAGTIMVAQNGGVISLPSSNYSTAQLVRSNVSPQQLANFVAGTAGFTRIMSPLVARGVLVASSVALILAALNSLCDEAGGCLAAVSGDFPKGPITLPNGDVLGRYDSSSEQLQPPGDCDPDKYRQLLSRQGALCGAAKGPLCNTVAIMQCILARVAIAKACFRNGDKGHRIAVSQEIRRYEKCR